MSTRTIIEINHDYLADLSKDDDGHFKVLLSMLRSGVGANEKHWNTDLGLPGVRILGQRHHSETLKLEVR
jgi:hypothetical protein